MRSLLEKLLKGPVIVFSILFIISGMLFLQMKENTEMETDLDEYMPKDHPAFVYSDKAEEWFDIQDGIIVAVENSKGVYSSETLDTLKQMTIAFQKMDEIDRDDVTSLYTADNITGTELGLDVEPFFTRVPDSEGELNDLRKKVETNDMTYGRMVSKDGTVAVIIAEIDDDVFTQAFYDRILKTGERFENDDIKVYVAGRPIVEGTMALLAPADMKKMVPIVLVIIILTLFLILRSVRGTVLTMSVVLFSVIWAFGVMAWMGIPIYAVTTLMPVMLIAIGVADGVHMFSHLRLFMQEYPAAGKREALADMIRNMWKPVLITSVTTSVGFISLLTSEVYPIKYFGIFTAFGVMTAMLFSLLFIPAGLMLFGLPKNRLPRKQKKEHVHPVAEIFANKVLKNRSVSVFVTAAVIVLSLIGMQKVWINSSFLDKFEDDSDIVQTDRFINDHFGGTTNINLVLDAGEDGQDVFKNPEVLKLVNELQQNVEDSLDVVGSSFGITDYIRRMNKVMHADKEAYNRIPDTREMVAQYLLLYEMSGDPEDLNKVVDYDYAKANVTFQLKSDNTIAINSVLDVINSYSADFANHDVEINYAGSGYTGLVFTDLILEGQIKSLVLSLGLIIVLLSLMFKNIKVGLIGSIPIMATAFIGFGVMGFLNIPLSTTTALLASIAIGIGIDYAVHFLQQYRVNASITGDKVRTAQKTMNHTGRAISFNAIVVIAGFLVLLFSVFPPNRQLGALVSLNMFTSFVGTITVMLALLNKTNIWFKKK